MSAEPCQNCADQKLTAPGQAVTVKGSKACPGLGGLDSRKISEELAPSPLVV